MQASEFPEDLSPHTRPERADRRLAGDSLALRFELEKLTRQLERSEARFRDVIERNPQQRIADGFRMIH